MLAGVVYWSLLNVACSYELSTNTCLCRWVSIAVKCVVSMSIVCVLWGLACVYLVCVCVCVLHILQTGLFNSYFPWWTRHLSLCHHATNTDISSSIILLAMLIKVKLNVFVYCCSIDCYYSVYECGGWIYSNFLNAGEAIDYVTSS